MDNQKTPTPNTSTETNAIANTNNETAISTPQTIPQAINLKKDGLVRKQKLVLFIVVAVILSIGGGAVAMNYMQQNNPDYIWKKALDNTSKGFASFATSVTENEKKGGSATGAFKVEQPIAADGNFSANWFNKNVESKSSVGVSGVRATTDIRAIEFEGSDYPDIYVNIAGLESVESLVETSNPSLASAINRLNGNWLSIDHTLLEQLEQSTTGTGSAVQDPVTLTTDDYRDISNKTSEIISEYLFSSDTETAVITVLDQAVKEDFDGVETFKYNVSINKDNLKKFIEAYKNGIQETRFDEFVVSMDGSGRSFEEIVAVDELLQSVDQLDLDSTKNEMWVDIDQKIIRNLRITPTDQDRVEGGYIEFALPYDGGDVLPFTMRFVSGVTRDTNGTLNVELVAGYNLADQSVNFSFSVVGSTDQEKMKATGTMRVTPSDEEVNPVKPDSAQNIIEFLNSLGVSETDLLQTTDQVGLDGIGEF